MVFDYNILQYFLFRDNPIKQKRNMSVKKKRRIIKRTLVKEIRRPEPSVSGDGAKQTDDPNRTGTRVVYCNQWECYSHLLCVSDGPEN
jgi:hypothetical protein